MSGQQGRVRAPEFLPNRAWFNSAPLTLRGLRGKVVILEFWTSGCINCQHNIPQLERLRAQFGNALVVVGVHSAKFQAERGVDQLRDAVARLDIGYPVVDDAAHGLWAQYAVRAWPTVVVIDPAGYVVATYPGEFLADELAPQIGALLDAFAARGQFDQQPLDAVLPVRAAQSPLRFPSKLLHAPPDRLFVADTGNHRVLELRLSADADTATIVRAFGSGTAGLRDGVCGDAALHAPRGLALHTHGQPPTLYIADSGNHAVRAVDLHSGAVRTIAGTGEKAHGRIGGGQARAISLRSPWALAALGTRLLVAMAGSHQLWALDDDALLVHFAGMGYEALVDGPLLAAGFNQPSDIGYADNMLFIADVEASAIRAVALQTGFVTTLIGQGLWAWGDADGVGDAARLQHPQGLVATPSEATGEVLVYIADTYNHKIKQLVPATRRVTTLCGGDAPGQNDGLFATASLNEPDGLAWGAGRLYIADTNNHAVRVAELQTGTLQTLAIR
jgi:thiol-disulfide isomerase/thioredoxin